MCIGGGGVGGGSSGGAGGGSSGGAGGGDDGKEEGAGMCATCVVFVMNACV